MVSPETDSGTAARGAGAGPPRTAPSLAENWAPWHGHTMVLLVTVLTVQPSWVHTALNAL